MTLGTRMAVMKDGRLEQAGTPLAIFERPVNTFVAQFVGSPAMNLVGAGVAASLVEQVAPSAQRAEVLLGIRPHDIALVARESGGADASGQVQTVEPLGSVTIVHVVLNGADAAVVRVVVPGDTRVAIDETVGLRFRPDRLHVFDGRTGRRLE